MAGTLYIVGTPIGNLKDITYRAVETLRSADIIACEDTRVSLKLLSAYEIKKPLVSYYKQTERESTEKIMLALVDGKNVALITDAGMPAISDPGAVLVAECRKAEIKTEVVPGPSAVVSAVALSGITEVNGFTFLGFLAEKTKDKTEQIKDFIYSPLPLVFYSSPHDINDDGKFLYGQLGDRKVYIVKELTKLHERVEEQRLSTFEVDPRGEYVLIVMPSENGNTLNELSVRDQVMHYMKSGMTKKDAIKRTSADRKVDKNTVYSEVLDL